VNPLIISLLLICTERDALTIAHWPTPRQTARGDRIYSVGE
jgi:hypothetical protein